MTRVAVVGGGQLARMMAPAATAMGVTLRVLVESPEASAALAAHETVVGLPGDADAVRRLLADPAPDVVTWEHEHIPDEVFALAVERGVPTRPGREALLFARDKIEMRKRLGALGLPMPAWREVETEADVEDFLAVHGGIGVLKTARGGYDGKGVRIVRRPADADEWLTAAADGGPPLLIEEKVPYARELAIQVARRPSGEVRSWPLVESIQRDGVCSEVIAPAPGLTATEQAEAESIARTIAEALDVTGMLAVELFEVGGRLLINELAMRPHNSGHWSIEGSVTSQFEQHLRAVLDWPLGETAALAPVTVMANVLGGSRVVLETAWPHVADAGAKVHLYGKGVRPGRKVGHVTVMGATADDVRRRAAQVAAVVRDGEQS
ncbi:5-(carboxyamino)imidazole ribonucleotide synthase [Demequina sp. TTPB684]|uniref:5-(carboxyamino)imidazole ribonucleotide synthase n=1 Tax=unclassified Demequina TaxID=2620311 RepID=UPI001CF4FEC7|nr:MULTISPECIES: 5-(carboxyamino)imidazole ribonucleotide synthase [unclassified Demequina]MCB2411540.1 5-(carboxyamino)imidazole ribonucleotide synthase [Demequina sp. TTPB684]UPU88543.1 5-(carboxyamino)imidazole ribonucleotide synthase [Demequina sp. TMPB413]